MGVQDAKLFFGSDLVATATAYVGDVVDLGAAGKDGWGNTLAERLGGGQTIYLNIVVTTAIDNAGSIELCYDDALSSGNCDSGTWVVQIPFASLTVGRRIAVTVPARDIQRYLQMHVTDAGSITTGAFDAWLSSVPVDTEIASK